MAQMQAAESLHQQLFRLEHEVLEMVATGQPLGIAMEYLCRRVETIEPSIICSLLSVDDAGRLHPVAAPSLPAEYSNALDNAVVGPRAGSCGTAAFRGEPVEVMDIETDPLWADFKDQALTVGLRACWSSPIWARDGRVIGTFAFYYRTVRGATDFDREIVATCIHLCAIALEREHVFAELQRIAYHDSVTGLLNRTAFQERSGRLIAELISAGGALAIHLVDIDDFKGINETLGHHVGDLLLAEVAARLSVAAGGDAIVARLGGDEFAVVFRVQSADEPEKMSKRLLATLEEPFLINDHRVKVSGSEGIARLPEDGCDLLDLMKNADLALNQAKADPRTRCRFYVAAMADAARARRTRERDLRQAIAAEEFSLVFQPIVNLASGTIKSCEALIRWQHPQRGIVLPSEFITLAEEMGLIEQIGEWVVRQACRHAAAWPTHVVASVNLSPLQLRQPGFVLRVAKILDETGFPPDRLEFEITETVILTDDSVTQSALRLLKDMRIGFALDDFGTGYSSLRSLRTFPIGRIKIDQTFVHEFGQTAHSTSIVRTIIALGRDLGMATTAEGVETGEQCKRLLAEGCDEGQGYFFSRPKTPEAIVALLNDAVRGKDLPDRQTQRFSAR